MADEQTPDTQPDDGAAPATPGASVTPEVTVPTPAEAAKPAAADGEEMPAAEPSRRRRSKTGKHVPIGIAFIRSTFNNTMISITDPNGNVVAWGTAGRSGFKGSRKSTAFAATVVSQEAARQAVAVGMHELEVRVQGPGAGRESAIRALQSAGLSVTSIKDVTPIPHNGCRPPKRRRV